ncbi:MAG: hypothetical protein JWL69_4907 [Phycisphaerales bacterium]|nr:hypothetical protein [Phycisphaerales bacterium]
MSGGLLRWAAGRVLRRPLGSRDLLNSACNPRLWRYHAGMLRHVITLLSALSLLLCVATCVLWVRSLIYWEYVDLPSEKASPSIRLVSVRGRFGVCVVEAFPRTGEFNYHREPAPMTNPWYVLSPGTRRTGVLGVLFSRGPWALLPGWKTSAWSLSIPGWYPAPLFAVLALPLRGAVRQLRRKASGSCLTCGYDLRATPDRCPECGAVSIAPK